MSNASTGNAESWLRRLLLVRPIVVAFHKAWVNDGGLNRVLPRITLESHAIWTRKESDIEPWYNMEVFLRAACGC